MSKRVLIAAPIGAGKEYSINAWFDWISTQNHDDVRVAMCVNGRSKEDVDSKVAMLEEVEINGDGLYVLRDDNYTATVQEKLHTSRELIRQFAERENFDYILWLDTDTIPSFKNGLQKLLSWNVPVVSGVYFYKKTKTPVAMSKESGMNISVEELQAASEKRELIDTWGVGFGCLLMHKLAFTAAKFDYSKHGERISEDFMYCEELKAAGFKIFLDPWVICRHYSKEDFLQEELQE
jgi:hypothetical protein